MDAAPFALRTPCISCMSKLARTGTGTWLWQPFEVRSRRQQLLIFGQTPERPWSGECRLSRIGIELLLQNSWQPFGQAGTDRFVGCRRHRAALLDAQITRSLTILNLRCSERQVPCCLACIGANCAQLPTDVSRQLGTPVRLTVKLQRK